MLVHCQAIFAKVAINLYGIEKVILGESSYEFEEKNKKKDVQLKLES